MRFIQSLSGLFPSHKASSLVKDGVVINADGTIQLMLKNYPTPGSSDTKVDLAKFLSNLSGMQDFMARETRVYQARDELRRKKPTFKSFSRQIPAAVRIRHQVIMDLGAKLKRDELTMNDKLAHQLTSLVEAVHNDDSDQNMALLRASRRTRVNFVTAVAEYEGKRDYRKPVIHQDRRP